LEEVLRDVPMPVIIRGDTEPVHANGKAHAYTTPETIQAPYQSLKAQYSLFVVLGPLQGQHFLLKSIPLRIGRGPEVGIALDADLNVSRKHAEIYEWNGRLRIRDLGSSHGILVNGVAVNDQALSPGDRITLGDTVLILRELS
jgi:pSer/pThr/pTyr-binding forkhead associated (FHA) protein